MGNWVHIGSAGEVAAGACQVYEAAGSTIAVFGVGDELHAIDNACLHRGGPLGEGLIEGALVTCPWHHWQYDVTTGRARFGDGIAVRKYPLEVRDGQIWVEVD